MSKGLLVGLVQKDTLRGHLPRHRFSHEPSVAELRRRERLGLLLLQVAIVAVGAVIVWWLS